MPTVPVRPSRYLFFISAHLTTEYVLFRRQPSQPRGVYVASASCETRGADKGLTAVRIDDLSKTSLGEPFRLPSSVF